MPLLPGRGEPRLVSVIVPTFNRRATVAEAIRSVLASSHDAVEVIVIDDGSIDDTWRVVSEVADPRVRYVRTRNRGMSAARNLGLSLVRGEFIAFLDSDDAWRPWKLAAQLALFARHPEVGLIWTDAAAFDLEGRIQSARHLRQYLHVYGEIRIDEACPQAGTLGDLTDEAPVELTSTPYHVGRIFKEMFIGNLVLPSTAIVRRELLQQTGGFEIEVTGRGGEDYHFYYKMAERGIGAFLDAPTILYRVGDPGQLSNNGLMEARGNMRVVAHWLDRARTVVPAPVVRRRLSSAHAWLGAEELHAGERRAAATHLWKSLRMEPLQPHVATLLVAAHMPPQALPVLRSTKGVLQRAAALIASFMEVGA